MDQRSERRRLLKTGTALVCGWVRTFDYLRYNICVATGIFRDIDAYGNKSYKAEYECRDGRVITRQGQGNAPGLIRDPYKAF